MTQITVDLTGIQNGDTLVYSSVEGKFVAGPASVAPKTIYLANGDTLSDLGTGDVDGQVGLVRVGEYPDDFELRMRWRDSAGKWFAQPVQNIKTNDAWAVDLVNQLPAAWKNAWCRPIHGVGWYHGSRACLESGVAIAASSFDVEHLSGTFAEAGQVVMQGDIAAYTGLTDNEDGTWTFTGVTGIAAAHSAHVTPVIPYEDANAGDTGGWGLSPTLLDHADELWTAGFRLQDRIETCYLNGSADSKAMDVTVYWWNYDLADGFAVPSPFTAPSGALGHGITLTGNDIPGKTGEPAADRTAERGFDVFSTDWQAWTAGTPTKRVLSPYVYCRMPTAATDTGEMYALTYSTRWIGTPT